MLCYSARFLMLFSLFTDSSIGRYKSNYNWCSRTAAKSHLVVREPFRQSQLKILSFREEQQPFFRNLNSRVFQLLFLFMLSVCE